MPPPDDDEAPSFRERQQARRARRGRSAATSLVAPAGPREERSALTNFFNAVQQATGGQAGLNVARAGLEGGSAGQVAAAGARGLSAGQIAGAVPGAILGSALGPVGTLGGGLVGSFLGSLFDPSVEKATAEEVARDLGLPTTAGKTLTGAPGAFLKGLGSELLVGTLTDPATFLAAGGRTLTRIATETGNVALTREGTKALSALQKSIQATEKTKDFAAFQRATEILGRATSKPAAKFLERKEDVELLKRVLGTTSAADVAKYVDDAKSLVARPGLELQIPFTRVSASIPGSRAAVDSFGKFTRKLGDAAAGTLERVNAIPVRLGEELPKPTSRLLTGTAAVFRREARRQFGDEGVQAFERAALQGVGAVQNVRDGVLLEAVAEKLGLPSAREFFANPSNLIRVDLQQVGRGQYAFSRAALTIRDAVDEIGARFGLVKLPPAFERAKRNLLVARTIETLQLAETFEQPLRRLTKGDNDLLFRSIDQASAVSHALLAESARRFEELKQVPGAWEELLSIHGSEVAARHAWRTSALSQAQSAFDDVARRVPDELRPLLVQTHTLFQTLARLDEEAGVLGNALQFYVPHVFRDKKRAAQLFQGGLRGLPQSLKGSQLAREVDEMGHFLVPTAELGRQLALDPITNLGDVVAARIAASVRARSTRAFLRQITPPELGLARPRADFVRETVTQEDPLRVAIKQAYDERAINESVVAENLDGELVLDRLQRQLGVGTSALQQVEPEVGRWVTVRGVPELEGMRVPTEIAAQIADLAGPFRPQSLPTILKVFDSVNNFFKASVTGWFAGFHKRNIVNDVYHQGYVIGLGALNPFRQMAALRIPAGAKGIYKTRFGAFDYEDIHAAFKSMGLNALTGSLDVAKGELKGLTEKLSRIPIRFQNWYSTEARMNLFLGLLDDGYDPVSAAEKVVEYLFDYSKLTNFEREWMRRLVPFYSWTRQSLPLELKTALSRPFVPSLTGDFVSAAGPDDKQRAELPPWLADSILTKMGMDGNGNLTALRSIDAPIEDLLRWVDSEGWKRAVEENVMAPLTPILRLPVELLAERTFFSGRPIKDRQRAAEWIAGVPGLSDFLEAKTDNRGVVSVNGFKMAALQGMGLSRAISTINRLANPDVDAGYKLLDFLGNRIEVIDQLKARKMREAAELEEAYERGDLQVKKIPFAPTTAEGAVIVSRWRANEARRR